MREENEHVLIDGLMELIDAPRIKINAEVENRCHICGLPVMRTRKLAKVRCFDCRKKYSYDKAIEHYKNKNKAL